ncbi:MAG: DUF4339 domain-containing protein [Pirellulales bacterium]
MNEWYYATAQQQQQQGPVSKAELQRLLGTGQLSPQSLVWNATLPDWQPAEKIPGLIPSGGTLGGFASSSPGVPLAAPAHPTTPGAGAAPAMNPANPYASPYQTASFGRPPVQSLPGRWTGHVKAVGIMLLVAGILGILGGLGVGGFIVALLSGALPDFGPGAANNDPDMVIVVSVYGAMAAIGLLASIFLVFAGLRCLKLRSRVMAIVACSICVLMGCSFGCGGIAHLGVGIYGLVILLQSDVGKLFEQQALATQAANREKFG